MLLKYAITPVVLLYVELLLNGRGTITDPVFLSATVRNNFFTKIQKNSVIFLKCGKIGFMGILPDRADPFVHFIKNKIITCSRKIKK
jgi:hypothetical protein